MFTGLVEEIGRVRSFGRGRLVIAARKVLEGTVLGDSIAVNGVCLTVTELEVDSFAADVMPVTLARSSLGALRVGAGVNLERALTLASRLGGHIVSGHIDGVGCVVSVREEANARILRVEAEPRLLRYILPCGSVALDGVSLTASDVTPRDFGVSLIPHTRGQTTLDSKKAGDSLNIENDVIGKYVERLLTQGSSQDEAEKTQGVTKDLLSRCGFGL